MKSKFGLVLLAVVIIILVIIGVTKNKNTDQVKQTGKVFKIGTVIFPGYFPLYVAQEKDFYGDTKVELVFMDSVGELRSAMEAGQIDAFGGTYDMFQTVKGKEPAGIAFLSIDESRGADAIIAPKSITTPEQLKGVTIGTEPGFPAYVLLQSFLDRAGLTLKDVDFKDIPSKDIAPAYISKSITVGGTYEPYISEILKKSKDSHILISTKDMEGLGTDFLWVTPETFKNRKSDLLNIASGYLKAVDFMKTNEDEAFGIGAKAFGVSLDEMKSFKEGIIWPDLAYNQKLFFEKDSKTNAHYMYDYINKILLENEEIDVPSSSKNHISDEIIKELK